MTCAILITALLSACGSREVKRPTPISITRPRQRAAPLPDDAPPPIEEWDHWLRELNEFMSPAEMREHVALPRGKRLELRHRRLMDLTLRKALLDSIRRRMSNDEIERFRRLSSYAECRDMAAAIKRRR